MSLRYNSVLTNQSYKQNDGCTSNHGAYDFFNMRLCFVFDLQTIPKYYLEVQ